MIRIIKAVSKKDLACVRCFLAVVSCCLIIFGVTVVTNICKAISQGGQNTVNARTIIIDPGHGGEDGGAVGDNNIIEKDINLSISLYLRDMFKSSGFDVIMTREDDRSIHDSSCDTLREKKVSDLHNRSKLIEKYPNAVFISIHQNKFEQSQYSGTQVFYSKNDPSSKLLAGFIQNRVHKSLQPNNDRVIKPAGKNLYILYHAKTTAVMAECGFLSNPTEAQKLTTTEYQKDMAFAVYSGTLEYLSGKSYDVNTN